ncbi:MAG: glycyl-radical enzyme activating protein [Nanoarchaeota archaeon]|nr:glycyl-radical enzyme activating protein [Nanoarchaeota archaeon]MBU1321504.1 glycyl-radical enzyme activating protein [Nanoarchaeota archaeon]MBU1597397.1 glycyl-radical enzyme activating protein [Nanoarchaeota archaeon]MBU2441246.1 glycyl-radical enzyme activating protein [Nanoarchaeota archaeon]
MKTATIFDIKRYAIHDGPGIRTSIFFKGCPSQCEWCHNPEARDLGGDVIDYTSQDYMLDSKLGTGKRISIEQLMNEIEKDVIFYDTSGGGVTFSGGEPLLQYIFLEKILNKCKQKGIHTALDTTGYTPQVVFDSIIDKVDLFLYDLKLIDDDQHKKFIGISNYFIHENLKKLAEKQKNVWIRFPVIPKITDTKENIEQLKEFVSSLNFKDISLLPYHKIADSKYEKLGLKNKMKGIEPPSEEFMHKLKKEFEKDGFNVRIEG